MSKDPRQKYNCRKDWYDPRDLTFSPQFQAVQLPSIVDNRSENPPIYNQQQIGSCTGNGGARILSYSRKKRYNLPRFEMFSRLFIYANERLLEGTFGSDNGASIRDCIKVLASKGACYEQYFLYSPSNLYVIPSQQDYTQGAEFKIPYYARVNRTINDFKTVLVEKGCIIIGFTVYESFEGEPIARTGIMTMPTATEKPLGGHCVVIVGYDDTKQAFIVANSWGTAWGDKGYFYMPYEYILNANLSTDFWTISV